MRTGVRVLNGFLSQIFILKEKPSDQIENTCHLITERTLTLLRVGFQRFSSQPVRLNGMFANKRPAKFIRTGFSPIKCSGYTSREIMSFGK